MNEEEKKIDKILEQYAFFIEATGADIATSIKGRRFFFFTDNESGLLYSVAEFNSAKELEQILLNEIAIELNTCLQNSIEVLSEKVNYTNFSCSSYDFGSSIHYLAQTLETIYKEFSNFPTFKSALYGLSAYINNCKKS